MDGFRGNQRRLCGLSLSPGREDQGDMQEGRGSFFLDLVVVVLALAVLLLLVLALDKQET